MAEDALLLQRMLKAVHRIMADGGTAGPAWLNLGTIVTDYRFKTATAANNHKQYLEMWLIGLVNLFSTSYSRM